MDRTSKELAMLPNRMPTAATSTRLRLVQPAMRRGLDGIEVSRPYCGGSNMDDREEVQQALILLRESKLELASPALFLTTSFLP
jgi:hypothetical protein